MTKKRKAFLCYVRAFNRKLNAVIYYDEVPRASVNGKESLPDIVKTYEISPEYIENDEVSISFAKLEKLYPSPQQKQLTSSTSNANKEKQMPRPVTGFLTASGQFFESQEEADVFETRTELARSVTEVVYEKFPNDTVEAKNFLVDDIIDFIWKENKAVYEYIVAKRTALAPRVEPQNEKSEEDEPEPNNPSS